MRRTNSGAFKNKPDIILETAKLDSTLYNQNEMRYPPINIAYEPVKIDFPFEVEDVESVEMYHYDGVPASAEKKVVVAENDIKTLYDKFKGLSLKDKTTEETAGADVTSFRFNLSDGTSYDLIYACYGVKNGELKSAAGGFKYFTSADIGSYWNNLNTELEAIPINESELP